MAEEAKPRPGRTVDQLVEQLGPIMSQAAVIVGIGSELRGDDAAGVHVARRLAGATRWPVIEAGSAPESFLGKIVQASPDLVVLIDAVDCGTHPGSVIVRDAAEVSGAGPSTHGPAPAVFIQALMLMHPCRCLLVGIQPERMDTGAPLSDPVAAAVERIIEAFTLITAGAGS